MKYTEATLEFAVCLTLTLITLSFLGLTGCTATHDPDSAPNLSATIPGKFHGTWTYHSSGIHPAGGEAPWVLTARTFQAHESSGKVRSVSIHGENAITVTHDVSAEGEKYVDETRMKISPDGSTLEMNSADGNPFTLYRVR